MSNPVETPLELKNPSKPSPARMADRRTPLIRNAWYFVALASDISRELTSRTVLDKQVLLYRTAAGKVVALHDRCPHRSFPLSRGVLNGDVIVCGYHGMQFDQNGKCLAIPANPTARAERIWIRQFPIVEQGPILWIWMGEPAGADATPVPDCSWLQSDEWTYQTGSYMIDATYVSMHENLLDLTHFAYLHGDTVGTEKFAQSPLELQHADNKVGLIRVLHDNPAPPAFDRLMGLHGRNITRSADGWFDSPGAHLAVGTYHNPHPEPGEQATFHLRFAHLITPLSREKFHYQFFAGRDFALEDQEADQMILKTTERAFQQDREALQWIEHTVRVEGSGFRELSFASDKPGLAMKRIIAQLAASEANLRSG